MASGEILNPHDHDRGLVTEQKLRDLEQRLTDYIAAHVEKHVAEADNRALALAALQSQTRLVFAVLGLLITLIAVAAAVLALR